MAKNFLNPDKDKLSLKGFSADTPKKSTQTIENNGYKKYVDTVKSGGNGKAVLSSFGKPKIKTPFQGFKEEQRRHIEYITPQMARDYADIVSKTHRLTISDVEKKGILEEATRALIMDAKDKMYGSDLDEYKAISQRFEKSREVNEHENLFRQLQGMEYRKRKAEDYFLFDRERDIQKGIIAKENRNIEKYKSQLDKLNREQFTPEKGIVNHDALKEKYGIEQKENGEEKVLTGNERFDNILYSGAFEDAAGKIRRAQLQSEYFERQLKPFEKIRNEINEPGGKEILQRRYQNDMDFRNEFDNLIKGYQQFAKVAPVIENNFNEAVKEYEREVNISNKKAVMGERNYTIETLTKEALGILEFSKASEEGREKAKKQGWELPEAMPRYVNGEYIPHSMDDSFSENEQNIYYALFNVNPQKAAQYRKALKERYAEDWHNEETEKIINNPLSAGVTLAVSDILKYPEAVINTITGGKLGASGYNGFGELSNRIRGNMIKNSDGAGRKIIETGLGIGDMLAAQIAAGGKGVKIASALMGTNAASSAMDSARARGGNEAQIYASGVAAGTIEYLLNKLGTERLLNMIGKPSHSILKAMATNGVSEFAEEFLTEVAQNLSDTGIMGNKSQLSNYINSLIQSGMGEEEAKKTAIKDMFLNQPFDSGIVGFLTGSIMGGGNAAISTVSEGMQAIKNPNEFINYTDSIINSDVSSLSGKAEALRSEVERYRNKAKNSKHTLGTLINSGKAMAAAGEFSSIPKVVVQREGLQKSERTFLERLSKITKANIIYTEIPNAIGETGVLKGGIFSAGDNTILIDYRTSAADILKFVAGHEAGHSSEGTKWHNALKNFVKSEMGEEYENEVSKKIETHKKAGNILSRIDAENEVVSDYAGKVFSEEGVAERMAKRDYGTAKLFLDSIKDIGNKIKTSFGAESASGIEEGARLLERALGMRNPLQQALSVQYSIDENFINNYNKWVENGRPDRQTLTVGRTSEALRSINVKDQEIKWDTSKINDSLKKHAYLDDGILKQIPNLLENPIIVMQSKEFDSRITMFGEVYDTDGLPIMAVLELLPTNRQGTVVLDEIKLVSTHSRKDINNPSSMSQTQNLINESDIYYVEPDKKRTNNWLTLNRLQLPLSVTKYGPIKMITYPEGNVNTYNMQNEKNNSEEKTEMQIALEKAGIDSSMFEGDVKNSVTELTDEQREAVREAEGIKEASKYLTYENLVKHDDIMVVDIDDAKIGDVISEARRNAREKGHPLNTDSVIMVKNKDLGIDILVSKKGLNHAYERTDRKDTEIVNRYIGDYLENAIYINELVGREDEPTVKKSYVLLGYGESKNASYPAYFIINVKSDNRFELEEYGVLKASKGRKIEGSSAQSRNMGWDVESEPKSVPSLMSISSLLDIVKDKFSDVLPISVLQHYKVRRGRSQLEKDLKYSVTELTPEQQDAIKKVETEGKKVSEFYKNSLQKEIVKPAVKETDGPEGHTYKPVSNKTTYEKGKAYVKSIGLEAARAEIEDKFTEGIPLTSEEVGRAEYIFTQLQNSGDTMGTVRFAEMWNRSVTEGARALQALQILDKLTPEGRFLYVTREAERNTEKQIKELKGKRKAAFEQEVAEAKVKDKERQKREKAAAKAEEDFGVYAGLLTGDKIDAEYLKEIERLNEELKKNRQKYEDIKRQLQKEKREGENEERQEKTNDAGDGTLKKRERGKVKDKEDGVESDMDGLEVEAAKYRERIKRLEKKVRELSPKKSKKKEKPEYEKVLEKYGIDHMGEEDKKFVSDVLQTLDKLDTQKDLIDIILEQNEKRGRVNPKWLRKSLMRNDVALLKDTAWHQVIRMVQDKKKESFVKKISSLRIMAMLLNGRTFSRNMISNLCFNGIDATATNIAVVFDSLIAPFTKNRTVAYDKRGFGKGGLKVINEARRKSATEIVLDLQPGENKYGLGRQAVFKNRPLTYLERLMGYSLTTTDEMSKAGIERSIRNGLLKLKEKGKCNFTEEQIEEISDEVAKYRTFQDENGVSKAILRIKDALNTAGVRKGDTSFGLGDFVLPFAQVPGAIVMRSLEFSPVGYLKTLSIISDIRQNGELSAEGQRKLSLAFGRASTGTGLTLLFGFLAKIGLIKGSSDDEEQDSKAKALEKEQGLSGFKLNASGLKRVLGAILSSKSIKEAAKPREGDNLMQYDFLEPISNNMAVGFAWAQADEGFVDVAAISTAKFFEQIMDTTGFDTIKMILDPEKSTMEKVITFAVDTGTSFIPQVVKQTGGFFDKSARNAYNENGAGKIALSRLLSGIPGARNTLPAKINPFGGEVSNTTGNEVLDFLNAYINPGTISKYHSNKVIDEVQHLYKEIGVGRFLPNDIRSGKEISVGEGIKINLYGKTFEEYKKKVGKSLYKEYEVIFGTDIYKNASIEEKGELLEDVKNKVLDRIKYEIARDNGLINDVVIDTKLDVKTRKDYLNSIKVFYPEDVSKNFEAADMESAYGFIKYLEKENSLTGESAQAINKYLKERQKSEEYQSLKKILLENCNAAESFAPLVRNYENIFKWSKNGQKYKLEIKPDEIVKVMKAFDNGVFKAYANLYTKGYYTEKSGPGTVTNSKGKKVRATWNNMTPEQRNAKLSDYRSRYMVTVRRALGTQKKYKVTKEE